MIDERASGPMDLWKCWEGVRTSLPSEVVREVEAQATVSLESQIAITSVLIERDASPLWRDALYAWAQEQTDARDALRAMTRLDQRLGIWCACAVARTALRYVPEGEHRPRLAIETAERWVRGQATEEECRGAAAAAWDAANAACAANAANAAAARSAAATAAYGADARADAYAAYAAAAAAAAYAADAAAAAAANAAWLATRDRRLRDLCAVIADAVLTMPWETTR